MKVTGQKLKRFMGNCNRISQVKIDPAPDEWDRLYNVDFSIQVKDKYVGIQI